MSPRLDPVLRFPFSQTDQSRIDVGSIQVADTLVMRPNEAPNGFSVEVSFRVGDPAAGSMRIQLLGPGRITFIADDSPPMPAPNVLFEAADYASWPTRGILCLDLLPPAAEWMNLAAQSLQILPTRIWYGKVDIPLAFLQQTLLARREVLPGGGGVPTVRTNNPDWSKHAAARFLRGSYAPEIRLGATQADDDVVTSPMPLAAMGTDPSDAANFGKITLELACGRRTAPLDGKESLFGAAPGGNWDARLAGHPSSGCIPARHVFSGLRSGMIGASVGLPLPDAMLDSANGLRFRLIEVTRAWRRGADECSVYFPRNVIHIEDSGGVTLWEQWIPSHGMVFVPEDPAQPYGQVQISLIGPMKWLHPSSTAGALPPWRVPAKTTLVSVDLAGGIPHIIARLPMTMEMLVERRFTTPDPNNRGAFFGACTYLSLRRTMRALVDNRITGGRLLNEGARTTGSTRELMREAWLPIDRSFIPNTAAFRARDRATKQTVDTRDHPDLLVAYGAPSPVITVSDQIGARNVWLAQVMQLFFPDAAPQHVVAGATGTTVLTEGEVYSALWQSFLPPMHRASSRANFADAHVGRGAPGAMVAAGLATFVGSHERAAGETSSQHAHRIVGELLNQTPPALHPGALIQFWSRLTDFEMIATRPMASNETDTAGNPTWVLPGTLLPTQAERDNSYGHSPVFVDYTGNSTDVVLGVIDQTGLKGVELVGSAGARRLKWGWFPGGEQVWIAANWAE